MWTGIICETGEDVKSMLKSIVVSVIFEGDR